MGVIMVLNTEHVCCANCSNSAFPYVHTDEKTGEKFCSLFCVNIYFLLKLKQEAKKSTD